MMWKGKLILRKIASGIAFWSGIAVICVIALPTALLAGLIFLVWKGTDILVKRLEKE